MQKKMRVNKVVLGVILAGAILMSQGCALTSQQEFRAPEIKSLQMEVMGKITGQTEISPGVRLPDRCTLENRETTRTYLVSLFEEMGYEGVRHS